MRRIRRPVFIVKSDHGVIEGVYLTEPEAMRFAARLTAAEASSQITVERRFLKGHKQIAKFEFGVDYGESPCWGTKMNKEDMTLEKQQAVDGGQNDTKEW